MALKDRQNRRVGKEGRMQDWVSGGEGEDVSTMEAVVIRWGVGLELDTTEPMPCSRHDRQRVVGSGDGSGPLHLENCRFWFL